MKFNIYIIIFFLSLSLMSCSQESPYPEFQFSNFDSTPYQMLASAVKNNNLREIEKQILESNLNIDFQESKFNMSLLSLAIANNKKESFDYLLKLGANPNIVSGYEKNTTPLILSINLAQNCDNYYVTKLLENGANANFTFKYKHNNVIKRAAPLFSAIEADDETGNYCIEMVELLCNHGASINIWDFDEFSSFKEDVIYKCLFSKNMLALRYFIIDKKIKIPEYVYITGQLTVETTKYFTLKEMLSSDEYKFEFYPENERAKQEILDFLNNN